MSSRKYLSLVISLLVVAGCASPAPPEMYAVRPPVSPSHIELKSDIYAVLVNSFGDESRVNFLAGTYRLASETDRGQFYAGELPSLWRAANGEVVLQRGGVWIPRNPREALAVFFYRGEPIVAKSLPAALERRGKPGVQRTDSGSGAEGLNQVTIQNIPAGASPIQAGLGAGIATGLILAAIAASGDEQISGVPRNKEFAEALRGSFVPR